jgi:Holliday junction resolvasome RuvABC endonuclease subunit
MVKKIIRILSFDPGLTCCGWSLAEYNLETGHIYIIKRGKIEGARGLIKFKEKQVIFPRQFIQLEHLELEVLELMRYKPDYVVTEAAFYQPGRTAAYAALLLCIHTIEKVVAVTLHKPLFKIAPKAIKRLVTLQGDSDKLTVQEAILTNPYITLKETKQNPIEKMTEHEADAIGAAWAFVKNDLPSIS